MQTATLQVSWAMSLGSMDRREERPIMVEINALKTWALRNA